MKFAIAVLSHVVWLAGGTGSDMIATVNCHRYAKQSSAELIAEGVVS